MIKKNLKKQLKQSKTKSDMSFILLTFSLVSFFILICAGLGLNFNTIIISLLPVSVLVLAFAVKIYTSMISKYQIAHWELSQFKLNKI